MRNHYSLISVGTEGSTVKAARKSLVGKAKERPQQVRQAIDVLKKQGPVQTYRVVMRKLDCYSPMGYSSAGEVIDVGERVVGFHIGDRVACAGAGYASHAEVICVPEKLCVRLPSDADLKAASYNTLGAIALQGIRQADLRLGESCAVIGLGLLGQLTCLMLRVSGVKAFGVDIDEFAVETARAHCADHAWLRSAPEVSWQVEAATAGLGVDAAIITASTRSLDPINFAARIARKRGRIVVVGEVPTGFDRDPHWYRKELELLMSCSYGPGRYDPDYEEKGRDYPAAYVRWTENRNMGTFQELVHSGRIDLAYLTTHEFDLEEAPDAYDMIVNRSEPFLGVMLRYDVQTPLKHQAIAVRRSIPIGRVGIGFIGAGNYAQSNLLPHIPKRDPDVVCVGVLSGKGPTSKRVAERFGFEFCSGDAADVLANPEVNTVFIATRHNSHAEYVMRAMQAGKHVFVEKPLCLSPEQLAAIEKLWQQRPQLRLMVGYNRRFAPHAVELKKRIGDGPVSMIYRINAGAIPANTWIQDQEIGGGRIIGEICHYVDFLVWMASSLPRSVHATAMPDPHGLNDTITINLSFDNGSIGTICYFANGSPQFAKEYIEVYSGGLTGVIQDFKRLRIHGGGSPLHQRSFSQNKGQKSMLRQFLQSIKDGGMPLITPREIVAVTRACFAVVESIRRREAVFL